MARELKEIMFEKGKTYKCVKGINFGNQGLFIEGHSYECPSNNCLIDENRKDLFVPMNLINNFE